MVELYQLTVQCDNEASQVTLQVKMFEPLWELQPTCITL